MFIDRLALEPCASLDEFVEVLREFSYPMDLDIASCVYGEYCQERGLCLPSAVYDFDAHRNLLRKWIAVYGVRLLLKEGAPEKKILEIPRSNSKNNLISRPCTSTLSVFHPPSQASGWETSTDATPRACPSSTPSSTFSLICSLSSATGR